MQYNLDEHKHRFSIWTAARSVQRSWTTTTKISQVIHSVQLREFVENYTNLTNQKEFDEMHSIWCEKMIDEFRLLNVTALYGRVAKIIAVYLKTSIIIGANANDDRIRLIHPPVDRIVLKNLPAKKEFNSIRKLNWTQLDETNYWTIVSILREHLLFDWRLEMLWRPELDKD